MLLGLSLLVWGLWLDLPVDCACAGCLKKCVSPRACSVPGAGPDVGALCAGAAGLSHVARPERVPLASPPRLGRDTVAVLLAGTLQETLGRSLGGGAEPRGPSSPWLGAGRV